MLETKSPIRLELENRFLSDSTARVRTPGAFHDQPLYVPYLWEQAVADGLIPDEGETIVHLMVRASDRELFPEIGRTRFVKLRSRNGEFVREEV